ncbi:Fic family protein [Dyadobacter fanqingshengii]|uniref:Fic family protein n=1 Tax=Dyadobacter fanqingshengii TaxID=2906443 RepID=A0A9X1P9L2_9BACT|nr:Fic family protein [Dyadobacter fanqingshengii]MCF0040540.1 Fic family protein [Dyadobacter fanqingshengii]USJ37720.1 Fic family protein [Dyadobacter fanqingshengii]
MELLEKLTIHYQEITNHVIDYEKYNLYAISHHSTVIEGNTLTETETQIFLDEGLTAQGKPLIHHLMLKDHLEALQFVIEKASEKQDLNISFIKEIGSLVMKNTGTAHNTALGTFDSCKGDFRLLNVSAGIGGKSYLNYSKVPAAMEALCAEFGKNLGADLSLTDINDLAFLLHYQFVTIHPFADGNGRTGRLLMNFVQASYNKPLTMISSKNKVGYIESLVQTRKQENIEIFLNFMREQHLAYLKQEIERLSDTTPPKKNFRGLGLFF